MASKATKKPAAKTTKKVAAKPATKKATPKAVAKKVAPKAVATKKATPKVVTPKKVETKPVAQKVVKEEVKVEPNVTNSGKAEVIATRGKAKDSSILEGVLIGLGILLIGLCGGGLFLTKFLSTGDATIKLVTPIFGGVGLVFVAISIVFIIEGHRNNKNKNDCAVYYDNSKTIALNGYRGKVVNIKVNQLVKASNICKMLVVTYKKPNGKNKRINLGWSKDRKHAKERIAALRK